MPDPKLTKKELDQLERLAPYNNRILLTGAGFSKRWGGYLAAEIWSVIIGNAKIRTRPRIDQLLHRELNFEAALAAVEVTNRDSFEEGDGTILREAITEAFAVQDARIRSPVDKEGLINGLLDLLKTFTWGNSGTTCLFTLNQDLLLERYLLSENSPRVEIPGVPDQGWWFGREVRTAAWVQKATPVTVSPVPDADFRKAKGKILYIKLHGSMNWRRPRGDVMVLGGAKEAAINQFRILRLNTAVFRRALAQPDARLLVIGYGFGDDHINRTIAAAARKGLRLWIVDPRSPETVREQLSKKRLMGIWESVIGYYQDGWERLFDVTSVDHGLLEQGFWSWNVPAS